MTVSNFTDLQTEAIAYSGRGDLSARLPTFIQLCEEDMKRRLKLVQLEGTANVTVTSGSGSLPSDYVGARAIYWDGDQEQALLYVTPDRFNSLLAQYPSGIPKWYTVIGTTLKTLPPGDGTAVMNYNARLTSLSASATTNTVITSYPDSYFKGTLKELFHYTRNWEAKAQAEADYEKAIAGIISDHKDRKYPGPLEVRPR